MFRLNDEHWLNNLQGATYTKQLEDAVHAKARRLTFDYLVENDLREARLHETVAVSILDRKNHILGISINKPNDLILNNFGKWLAALIRAPNGDSTSVSLTDYQNSSQTFYTYASNLAFNDVSEDLGTKLAVGSDDTAAARTDYHVGTTFGTAPESSLFDSGTGSYAATYISFSGAISAGDSGTVKETGFYGAWSTTGAALKYIMLFHDILETPKSFVAGNTINVSYSISI